MKMFFNYFLLEAKRSTKALGKTLLGFVCTFLALTALVILVCHTILQTKAFPALEVGVVLPEDEGLMKVAATYVSTMDSVESICNFQYVTESEAKKMIETEELQVVLILPATLYEDLNYLEASTATMILPENETMGTRIFGELLESGVNLLQVAESGVSASNDVAAGYKINMSHGKLLNFLAVKYAYQALDRMDTYDEYVLSPMGTLNEVQFYFLAFFLLVLLMSGMHFSYLFHQREQALKKKLHAAGLNETFIAVSKISLMTLILLIGGSLLYLLGVLFSEQTSSYFLWFQGSSFIGIAIVALALSCHFYFIYTLAKDAKQGTLLLLITNLLFLLSSGIIVPKAYLPQGVELVGQILPSYSWGSLLQQSLFDTINITCLLPVFIWMILEVCLGVYLSWKNI